MKLAQEAIKQGWYCITDNALMKCEQCNFVGDYWAENDNFQEINGTQYTQKEIKKLLKNKKINQDDICNSVHCPSCSSWYYFETESKKK